MTLCLLCSSSNGGLGWRGTSPFHQPMPYSPARRYNPPLHYRNFNYPSALMGIYRRNLTVRELLINSVAKDVIPGWAIASLTCWAQYGLRDPRCRKFAALFPARRRNCAPEDHGSRMRRHCGRRLWLSCWSGVLTIHAPKSRPYSDVSRDSAPHYFPQCTSHLEC